MKTNKLITALIACSIVGSAAAAPKAQWASALNTNKSSSLITKEISTPQVNTSHDAVSFSYKLEADKTLNFDVQPFTESSRQFWLDSTGSKLASGISLPVTGGVTVVRISPLSNDKSIQLKASDIQIQINGVDTAIDVFADSANLKKTGAAFSVNSIALKLNANPGQLNLKVNSVNDNTPFVIHVLEKDSPYALSLASTKATYAVNEIISVNTNMFVNNKTISTGLQGYINRPDGSVLGELKFTQESDGSYSADINAVGAQGLAQGLWEVHVFAKGTDKGLEIMRDAQTSFAVNLNTAEFSNNLKVSTDNIEVGVNVGLEGRYEVRGVLMGTNKTGDMQPIAMTMTANWLKAGQQAINLELDQAIIAASGLSAPFALRNVQLTNQTYLAPVQTIQTGITITGLELDRTLDIK